MSYGINAYQHARLNAYSRVQSQSETPPAQAPAAPEQAAETGRPASSGAAQGLSRDEQHMISRYFPERPELSMRLYGPDQHARTVQPDALGSRLDVSG